MKILASILWWLGVLCVSAACFAYALKCLPENLSLFFLLLALGFFVPPFSLWVKDMRFYSDGQYF